MAEVIDGYRWDNANKRGRKFKGDVRWFDGQTWKLNDEDLSGYANMTVAANALRAYVRRNFNKANVYHNISEGYVVIQVQER